MNIEQYNHIVNSYCLDYLNNIDIPVDDYIQSLIEKNDQNFQALIKFRVQYINDEEKKSVLGYLGFGFYLSLPEESRIACFLIHFDIEKRNQICKLELELQKYREDHQIFLVDPPLWSEIRIKDNNSLDYELLQFRNFSQIDRSEIIVYRNKFLKLNSYLNSSILEWSRTEFSMKPMFIRVNHNEIYEERPMQILNEDIIVPANPKWWKNLKIHNGIKEGAAYLLENCRPQDNQEKHWEYNVKGVRRLEIIAKRNNSGNLSMMIEELIEKDGLLMGQMIHLDTDAAINSDFNTATLNHLDLAINIYLDEDHQSRMNELLTSGEKITDATFRSHLFRIEGIPFNSLFNYARMFLTSKLLRKEWFENQFQIIDTD